jgi:hypothetical protein
VLPRPGTGGLGTDDLDKELNVLAGDASLPDLGVNAFDDGLGLR